MASAVLAGLADGNGVIKAKIDEAVVKERLSTGIYSKPSSAFRELYANELRACREARKRGLSPTIEVTVNEKDRTLTIGGVDSLGMTRERFANVLAVLGETDNQSGAEIGQFGIGYMSFLSLSDAILFEVRSLESGEIFAYIGNGDMFQSVPLSKPLDKTGTRVTITLKESVDTDFIIGAVRSICRCSEVDTFLTTVNEEGTILQEPEKVNTDPTLEGKFTPLGLPISVDCEDFAFHTSTNFITSGGLHNPKTGMEYDSTTKCETLLLRMPIEAPLLDKVFPFTMSILDIKDERKYPPTADRERLTERAQKDILERAGRELRTRLPAILDINTLDDFRHAPDRKFYRDEEYRSLKGFYEPSTETKEISLLCSLQVKECELYENAGRKTDFGSLAGSSTNIFYSDTLSKEVLYVLREEYEDAVLFKLEDDWERKQYLPLFSKHGIRLDTQEEYERIEAGLPKGWREGIPRRSTAADGDGLPYEIVAHESTVSRFEQRGSTYHRLTRSSNRLRTSWGVENVVFVDEVAEYLPILNQVDSRYKLSKNIPRAKGLLTLEKFVEGLARKEVETSAGKITFEGLLKQSGKIDVLVYADPRLASVYKPEGAVFIPTDPDTAFELAVWCTRHGIDYKIRYVVSEHEFREATNGADRYHYFHSFFYESQVQEESLEPGKMTVADSAFHVALAVQDADLVKLYLKALERMEDDAKACRLRDFVLDLWERAKRKTKP